MKRIGISIYPEKVGVKETIEYIRKAKNNGIKRIFTNFLEVKKTDTKRIESYRKVWTYAKNIGFEVIVDVNPLIYKEFNLPSTEIKFFQDMGATGIRLDEDFGGIIEAKLSNNSENFKIELNASSSTKTIEAAIKNGANVENLIACHNFYPMEYTGLEYEKFLKYSSFYKALKIRVAAFVTLNKEAKGIGPWGINDGMPTIEEHRYLSLKEQIIHMLSLDVVDDIIISQQGATEEQMKLIKKLFIEYQDLEGKTIELDIELLTNDNIEQEIIFYKRPFVFDGTKQQTHTNRPDNTSYFIRSTIPRLIYKNEKISVNNSKNSFKIGDIIILNENKGRYKGELHIVTREFESTDMSRNLVGRLATEDIYRLKYVFGGKKFILRKVKD